MSVGALLDGAPPNAWSKLRISSLDVKDLIAEVPVPATGDFTAAGSIIAGGSVRGSGLTTTARGGLADRWSIADITPIGSGTYAPAAADLPSSMTFRQRVMPGGTIDFVVPSDASMRANFAMLGIPVADGLCIQFVVDNQSTNHIIRVDPTGDPAYISVFSNNLASYDVHGSRSVLFRIWFRSGSGAYIFNCNL